MQNVIIRFGSRFERISEGNYDVRDQDGECFVDDFGKKYSIHVRDMGDGSWGTTLVYDEDNIPEDLPDYVQMAQEIEAEFVDWDKIEALKEQIEAWDCEDVGALRDLIEQITEALKEYNEKYPSEAGPGKVEELIDMTSLPSAELPEDLAGHTDYPIWACDEAGACLVGAGADEVQTTDEIREALCLPTNGEPDYYYAVWQRGITVYGVGETPKKATEDAREWVADYAEMIKELDEGNDSNILGKMEIIKISPAAKQKIDRIGGDVGLDKDEAGIYRIEDEEEEEGKEAFDLPAPTQENSVKLRYGGAVITVVARFEGEDYEEVRFIHPLTGQECETYSQAMQGWSEQSEEENAEWATLGEEIRKIGEDLAEKVMNCNKKEIVFKEA